MNAREVIEWIDGSPGLVITVCKDRSVILTYGHKYEVTGVGLIDAAEKLQDVLRVSRLFDSKHHCANGGFVG